jgi:regulator of protease activity HflC (stomatin/prohibitin superfamily)
MLPATIKTAIEGKLKQEQISQEYEFRIAKERKEAERKTIEAKGIYDFQTIVSKGINSDLLKWKGIEATRELAESQNTKVVIIGAGDSGLPIILGGDK